MGSKLEARLARLEAQSDDQGAFLPVESVQARALRLLIRAVRNGDAVTRETLWNAGMSIEAFDNATALTTVRSAARMVARAKGERGENLGAEAGATALLDYVQALPASDLEAWECRLNDLIRYDRIADLFPDEGPLRRELYVKHLEFFRHGVEHQERCFMAANRVGKTVVGAFETVCHLTGEYPEWWEGRRFEGPVDWWVASNTSETTRDIVQRELFGPPGGLGTGTIPFRCLDGDPAARRGVANAIDFARIKHVSGGTSLLGLKSYDQGRERFQGTKKHGVWLDEEPSADVYDECMVRLMTTNGIMMLTFTPLLGLSEIALRFLPELAPGADGEGVKARGSAPPPIAGISR